MDGGKPLRKIIAEPIPDSEPVREPAPAVQPAVPAEPVKVPA